MELLLQCMCCECLLVQQGPLSSLNRMLKWCALVWSYVGEKILMLRADALCTDPLGVSNWCMSHWSKFDKRLSVSVITQGWIQHLPLVYGSMCVQTNWPSSYEQCWSVWRIWYKKQGPLLFCTNIVDLVHEFVTFSMKFEKFSVGTGTITSYCHDFESSSF